MDSNSMLDFVQKAAEKQANAEGAAYASTLSVSLEHGMIQLCLIQIIRVLFKTDLLWGT